MDVIKRHWIVKVSAVQVNLLLLLNRASCCGERVWWVAFTVCNGDLTQSVCSCNTTIRDHDTFSLLWAPGTMWCPTGVQKQTMRLVRFADGLQWNTVHAMNDGAMHLGIAANRWRHALTTAKCNLCNKCTLTLNSCHWFLVMRSF